MVEINCHNEASMACLMEVCLIPWSFLLRWVLIGELPWICCPIYFDIIWLETNIRIFDDMRKLAVDPWEKICFLTTLLISITKKFSRILSVLVLLDWQFICLSRREVVKVRAGLAPSPTGILKVNFEGFNLGNLTWIRIGSLFQDYKGEVFWELF